jgi:hypothetical protein
MIRRRATHTHDWEVVDKTLVDGLRLDDAVSAAKAATGQVEYDEIVEATKPHMIVHYRCLCGVEKVERV